MAIERNKVGGSTQSTEPDHSIIRLKQILETLNEFGEKIILDDKYIQDECNRVVRELVVINVPTAVDYIRDFRNYLISIGQVLERIIRQSSNPEHIFISCLQTLYCLLVSNGKQIWNWHCSCLFPFLQSKC